MYDRDHNSGSRCDGGKKEFREKTANRIEVYQKYIASKRQEIEECRNREWTERNEIYIPAEQEIQQVKHFLRICLTGRRRMKIFFVSVSEAVRSSLPVR